MQSGATVLNPYARTTATPWAAVQSNKVYLPPEVLLVSISLASRQINAIRWASVRIALCSPEITTLDARLLTAALLAASLLLGGCATSRSELQLAQPSLPAVQSLNANAPTAVIRTVKDERTFEQAPDEPSTPSLGFEGALQATAEAKARAIGRKRNTFGKALGDVFLQDGQTVGGIVRENLAAALREAGFNVLGEQATEPASLVIDVHIRKFWAWIQPGFWAITVNADISTDLDLSSASSPLPVTIHVEDARQFVTDSVWVETIEKALQSYRREVSSKLSGAK